MGVRKSIVAGSFYPADKEKLKEQISDFLEKSKIKDIKTKKKIYGVIAPHAGYSYSGQCAAYSYKTIAESDGETFIILGTNHTSYAEANFALSLEDFETPLGIVKNAKEFSELLISQYKGKRFSIGETGGEKIAHQQEHSIEVQLPFLQFIFKNKFKIVPIICQIQDYENYVDFSRLLVKTAEKLKRKICVIASSDLTHYGSSYGFVPFSTDVKKNLYELDGKAVDLILRFRTKEFLEYSAKTTICGAGAIAACMEICELLGSKKAELLKYYTSGDVVNDYVNAVGYASVVFE